MKTIAIYLLVTLSIVAVKTKAANQEDQNINCQVGYRLDALKLDIQICLRDTVFDSHENVSVQIQLTNKTTEPVRFLFTEPKISTGGPWDVAVSVKNIETDQSILLSGNKAVHSSQFYPTSELEQYKISLDPNESVRATFVLDDLVVFDKNYLTKGSFELSLSFGFNNSNVVRYVIE